MFGQVLLKYRSYNYPQIRIRTLWVQLTLVHGSLQVRGMPFWLRIGGWMMLKRRNYNPMLQRVAHTTVWIPTSSSLQLEHCNVYCGTKTAWTLHYNLYCLLQEVTVTRLVDTTYIHKNTYSCKRIQINKYILANILNEKTKLYQKGENSAFTHLCPRTI